MGDDAAATAPRRRRGCLKWTCGCLVLFVLGGASLFYLLWRHLDAWDPDRSPWDHVPASAAWALEVHDVATLAGAAARDPGLTAFLHTASGILNRFFESQGVVGHPEELLGSSLEMYTILGPFRRALVPNAFLVGGGRGLNDTFLILQPPGWFGFVPGRAAEGVIERADNDTDLHLAAKSGWIIVGMSRAAVESVLAGWDAASQPFGPRPQRRDAYLALAVAPGGAGETLPAPEPNHFAFADPFAAAAPKPAGTPGLRLLVLPDNDAWHILADAAADRAWQNLAPGLAAADLPAPQPLRAAGVDAAASVRFAPDAARTLRARLAERITQAGSGAPRREALAAWLRDGWLADAGDAATLLAGPPTAHDAAYPGLPVAALGWETTADPADAARRFAEGLGRFVDALLADAAPNLRAAVTVDPAADGLSGRVLLPPVAVNGARPGWRFAPGQGWAATDTDILARIPPPDHLPLADAPAPADGAAEGEAAWAMSPDFVDGTAAWLADRFAMRPAFAAMSDGHRRLAATAGALMRALALSYPRGAVRIRHDVGSGRYAAAARIPHGVARTER